MAVLDLLRTVFAEPTIPPSDLAALLSPEPEIARGRALLLRLFASGDLERPPTRTPSPHTKSEKIVAAMEQHRRIRAEYTRVYDGATEEYFLAPYEYGYHPISGRPVLYATDSKHGDGQIHSFLWSRLQDVMLVDNTFGPVWPTQPDSVP